MSASVVYFIRMMPDGPIKIGYTTANVALRVKALQATSPHVLKWIGFFRGGRAEERAAHVRLGGSKLRGEWFYPTREVLDFVAEKCAHFDEAAAINEIFHGPQRDIVRKCIRSRAPNSTDKARALSRACKIDIWTIHAWLEGRSNVTAEQAAMLANHAGTLQ